MMNEHFEIHTTNAIRIMEKFFEAYSSIFVLLVIMGEVSEKDKSKTPSAPPGDILNRAHEAQLNKMLALVAVWFTLFIGLIGIFVALIGTSGINLEGWIKGLTAILGFVFAVGDGTLTMAILGKFQEIVFLEKQKSVGHASFFLFLKEKKVPYSGARLWDHIIRNGVLGISEAQLSDELSDYDYSRMKKG